MLEGDQRQLYLLCLVVSMTCLGGALLLSNAVFSIRHAWNFGWIGCLLALLTYYFSFDSRSRAHAAKLFGAGVCVAFYVTKCGYPQLLCRVFFCDMPLEFLVFATFFLVQLWFQWESTRNYDGLALVESQQENGLQRAGMGRVKTQWNLMEFGWYSETDSPHSKPTSPEDPGSKKNREQKVGPHISNRPQNIHIGKKNRNIPQRNPETL